MASARKRIAPESARPGKGKIRRAEGGAALQPAPARHLLSLQRSAGNRAVGTLTRSPRGTTGIESLSGVSASPAPGQIHRMSTMGVKNGLSSDTTYWPIYQKWFRVMGLRAAPDLLAPLENIDAVKKMLDEFGRSKEASYGEPELKKHELARDYGNNAVFKALVGGVDTGTAPQAQLAQLLQNFKDAGSTHFDYTMGSTSSDNFLSGTKGGDCNTVTRTFKLLAEDYFGIKVEYKTSMDLGIHDRFTAPKATTIDGKTGNVDNGSFWLFSNHYWVEAFGQRYDVLFGKLGVDPGLWLQETNPEKKLDQNPGVFGERKIWAQSKSGPVATRYTTTDPTL